MRVGLVRHFPVQQPMPSGWVTAKDLHAWRVSYDAAEPEPFATVLTPSSWPRCYSSDMRRTFLTAQTLFSGEIVTTSLLREPDIAPFQTGRLRLPCWMWRWVLRFAWMTGHASQRACRDDFSKRVNEVLRIVESDDTDILLFSHAGIMAYLRRALLKRGFTGPRFTIAEHARLYVFER